MFNLELDNVIQEIRRRNVKRLLIQIPYGLRSQAFQIADHIRNETHSETIVSANPCYGACDIAIEEASEFDADLILHFGHAPLPELDSSRILFVEAGAVVDIAPVISLAIKRIEEERRIGLVTTVQHIQGLKKAKQMLEDAGKTIVIPRKGDRATYDGQILGCDFESARGIADHVDVFLVIAGGDFHGVGVQIATGKRTLVCDPFSNEIRDMTDLSRRFLRKRYAAIEAFRKARKIGILIVTKSGQFNLQRAEQVRDILEEKGCKCLSLSITEMRPILLDSFSDVEAFVNTGCPRISLDDQETFRKPVLTVDETMIAVGITQWNQYVKEDPVQKGT